MKKLLFASTALVMSAGVAAANDNISFSGDARMGVVYNSANVALTAKTQFSARARMTVRMTRTTDSGLQVGATFLVNEAEQAAGNTGMERGTVFIAGDFGRLTMGNITGAVQGVVLQLHDIGYTGLANRAQWLSRATNAARTAARYEITFDDFTVMVSSDQLTASGGNGMAAIGVRYRFDGFTVAVGYESGRSTGGPIPAGNRADHAMIGVEGKIDMVTLRALYGRAKDNTDNDSLNQWGLSADAKIDAVNVTAYYMKRLNASKNYGIGASYDLGGGAKLMGGINKVSGGATTADFGDRKSVV